MAETKLLKFITNKLSPCGGGQPLTIMNQVQVTKYSLGDYIALSELEGKYTVITFYKMVDNGNHKFKLEYVHYHILIENETEAQIAHKWLKYLAL
jgi:hypothetical protein